MNKHEFIVHLRERLLGLPKRDMEESLNFYSEMIDDRMEEGLSEEAAVAELGSLDDIAAQIINDVPFAKIAKEKIKMKRRLKAWEIILLALGSPIWLSLAIAAFAVFFSLYAVIWSVIISFWAIFFSFVACALSGVAGGILVVCQGNGLAGAALFGAGLVCVGLSIFMLFGCKAATKGTLLLTKKIAIQVKKCCMGKENI